MYRAFPSSKDSVAFSSKKKYREVVVGIFNTSPSIFSSIFRLKFVSFFFTKVETYRKKVSAVHIQKKLFYGCNLLVGVVRCCVGKGQTFSYSPTFVKMHLHSCK